MVLSATPASNNSTYSSGGETGRWWREIVTFLVLEQRSCSRPIKTVWRPKFNSFCESLLLWTKWVRQGNAYSETLFLKYHGTNEASSYIRTMFKIFFFRTKFWVTAGTIIIPSTWVILDLPRSLIRAWLMVATESLMASELFCYLDSGKQVVFPMV